MKHFVFGLISVLFIIGCSQNDQAPTITDEMLGSIDVTEIRNTIKTFSDFRTRYHNDPEAIRAQEWLKSKWEEIGQGKSDVSVDFFYHPEEITPMPSVIATVKGTTHPEEIVVLGAHADSAIKEGVGMPATDELNLGQRSPGADDNASGIATITEIYRVLMQHNYRPERTFMFMAYSAEEIGLKGSEDIAKTFAEEDRQVISTLNFDLTSYQGSPDLDLVLINDEDYTDAKLNACLAQIADELDIKWEYAYCTRGCSDHASWSDAGFPATMLVEARISDITPHIHKVTDTFEESNPEHAVDFVRLSLAYLVEVDRFGINACSATN